MQKAQRELKKLAKRYGFKVEKTSGGHYRFVREGHDSVIASATASDWRELKNLEAELKRSVRRAREQEEG